MRNEIISRIVSRLDDGKTRKRPKEEAEAAREAFSGKELRRGRTGRKLRCLAFAFASACAAAVVVVVANGLRHGRRREQDRNGRYCTLYLYWTSLHLLVLLLLLLLLTHLQLLSFSPSQTLKGPRPLKNTKKNLSVLLLLVFTLSVSRSQSRVSQTHAVHFHTNRPSIYQGPWYFHCGLCVHTTTTTTTRTYTQTAVLFRTTASNVYLGQNSSYSSHHHHHHHVTTKAFSDGDGVKPTHQQG